MALPLVAVAGQLWFAWKYPIDWEGPIKGVYLQFAALPLCALSGVGCDWLWRRGVAGRIALAIVAVGGAAVAYYTFYCRFGSLGGT